MQETINGRVLLIMRALGLNNNQFAKALNVNPTVTFNVVSGRLTKPSYELLEKIVFTYDNINTDWLLKGVGKMFRETSLHSGESKTTKDSNTTLTLIDELEKANKTNAHLLKLIKDLSK